MENEPQYLFLETEHSARVRVGGRKGQLTDEQQEQQASSQHEPWGSVTWASPQSHWVTKSTPRCVAEEQGAVTVEAKPQELEGMSRPSGLTCCSQKRKARPADVRQAGHQLTNQNPGTSHRSLKTWLIPPPTVQCSPCENLPENLQSHKNTVSSHWALRQISVC